MLHWMNRHRQTDAVRRDVLKQVLAIVGSRSLNVEVSGLAKVKPSASETVRESVLLGTILASDSATLRDWLGLAYPGRGSIAPGLPKTGTFEHQLEHSATSGPVPCFGLAASNLDSWLGSTQIHSK